MLRGFHEHLISRTRFIDDLVEEAASQGAEQYVILGAGYDTRAHRLSLPSSLKIFEVDQAEVQTKKRTKLPKDPPNVENIAYVCVDFNHQSITEQLLVSGFDPSKSTIFTLEGVSQYVPKEAMAATIQEVGALVRKRKRRSLCPTSVHCSMSPNPNRCFGNGYPNPQEGRSNQSKTLAKVGEPWISFYTAKRLKSCFQNGFSVVENKTLEDLHSLYFTPVGGSGKTTLLRRNQTQIFKLEHFVIATPQLARLSRGPNVKTTQWLSPQERRCWPRDDSDRCRYGFCRSVENRKRLFLSAGAVRSLALEQINTKDVRRVANAQLQY